LFHLAVDSSKIRMIVEWKDYIRICPETATRASVEKKLADMTAAEEQSRRQLSRQ
jgi:hypothetical protein